MIKKIFRQMVVSQIISFMTVLLCMLIDSIVIGRYLGVDAIAAYGYASPVMLIFSALGSMLSAGIQMTAGQMMGKGDTEGINKCFSSVLSIGAALSVLGVALILIFLKPLCTILGAGVPTPDNTVFFLTKDYLFGIVFGAPAFLIIQLLIPFLMMSGSRNTVIVGVVIMTSADVVLDLTNALILNGGIKGMGLASSISYIIAFIFAISHFLRKDCIHKFSFNRISGSVCIRLLVHGIPMIFNQLSFVALVFVMNKLLTSIGGNMAVAAYSIIYTISNFCYAIGGGVGTTVLSIVSMEFSEEDRGALLDMIPMMLIFTIILSIATIAVILLIAPWLVGLFVADDMETVHTAVTGLRIFVFCLTASNINACFKSFYQGTGRVKLSIVISVFQNFLAPALFALLFSRLFGLKGVWFCFLAGECLTLLLTCIYVFIMNRHIGFSCESFALLPRDFGVAPVDCYNATLRSLNDIVNACKEIQDFLTNHGVNCQKSMFSALCIEEMAVNTLKFGFKESEDHSIDVSTSVKNNRITIRLRDDCKNFDTLSFIKLHRNEDPTSHIGIHMVDSMTNEATYVNLMGLNNLTMKLYI